MVRVVQQEEEGERSEAASGALVAEYARFLREYPDAARCLREMIAWQDRAEEGDLEAPALGWKPAEVHTDPRLARTLVSWGLADLVYQSNRSQEYSLKDWEAAQTALLAREEARSNLVQLQPVDPQEMFTLVVGHDNAKTILRYALVADRPVHVLLWGPPAAGKTLMLDDISKLPGAHMYDGSTISKAGLLDLLFQEQPAYLVIDELQRMAAGDRAPLLSLMASGWVSRLHHNRQERLELRTKVFAGTNEVQKLGAAFESRFAKVEVPAYTPPQFLRVAEAVLQSRLGLGPEMARLVSLAVVEHSLDIRDAINIASMARQVRPDGKVTVNPYSVEQIVRAYWPAVQSQQQQQRR